MRSSVKKEIKLKPSGGLILIEVHPLYFNLSDLTFSPLWAQVHWTGLVLVLWVWIYSRVRGAV